MAGQGKSGQEPDSLHLEREEADLLGVERRHRTEEDDERRYPHEHPEPAISEEAVVRGLGGESDAERREDVDEAFSDAMDRAGTEDDPEA